MTMLRKEMDRLLHEDADKWRETPGALDHVIYLAYTVLKAEDRYDPEHVVRVIRAAGQMIGCNRLHPLTVDERGEFYDIAVDVLRLHVDDVDGADVADRLEDLEQFVDRRLVKRVTTSKVDTNDEGLTITLKLVDGRNPIQPLIDELRALREAVRGNE